MRLSGTKRSALGSPPLAGLLTLAVATGLFLGSVDLHSLVHHRQNLEEATALDAHHPEPVHLDTARISHELPCLACLAGLKSQGRPPESPARPAISLRTTCPPGSGKSEPRFADWSL